MPGKELGACKQELNLMLDSIMDRWVNEWIFSRDMHDFTIKEAEFFERDTCCLNGIGDDRVCHLIPNGVIA